MGWKQVDCPHCHQEPVKTLPIETSEKRGLAIKFDWQTETVRRYRCPSCGLIWVDGDDVEPDARGDPHHPEQRESDEKGVAR